MSDFNPGPGGDLGGTEITTTDTGSFGAVAVGEQVNPAAPADGAGGILYSKSDGKLYWISNELTETDLTGGGGSSKQTCSVPIAGRFRIVSSTRLITHGSGMGNAQGGDWTNQRTELASLANTSFTSDVGQAYFHYTCAIAPFACTVKNITISIGIKDDNTFDYANPPKYRVWKGTYSNNSAATVTWSQLFSAQQFNAALSTQNNVSTLNKTSFDTASFAQGDLMALTFEGDTVLGSGKENPFIFQFTALED